MSNVAVERLACVRAGVSKIDPDICPAEDPPTDCFLRPVYLNSMFCLPPCTAGGGYGPCEVYEVASNTRTYTSVQPYSQGTMGHG